MTEELDKTKADDSEGDAPVEAEAAEVEAVADPETETVAAEPETDAAGSAAPPPPAPPVEKPSEEVVRDGFDWYVLRVASNKEDKVRETLERKVKIEQLEERINRILVPTLKEKRLRNGVARVVHRKLYPGYVFVEMKTEDDGRIPESVWFVVKETMGVGDFIGSGGKPSPMPMHDVEKMLAASISAEESPQLANLAFNPGDRVKVTEGPFENFEGVVDEINSQKGTVRVIATIFGRETPIEIEYWQVELL